MNLLNYGAVLPPSMMVILDLVKGDNGQTNQQSSRIDEKLKNVDDTFLPMKRLPRILLLSKESQTCFKSSPPPSSSSSTPLSLSPPPPPSP